MAGRTPQGIVPDGSVRYDVFGIYKFDRDELAAGSIDLDPALEDIHTIIENRVTEIAGETGAKLHTGRSRNDQVATDLRLYAKRELSRVAHLVLDLQRVLAERADEVGEVYLPGYTHLQRAQPVLAPHVWLCWCEKLDRDRARDAEPLLLPA